MLLHRTLPLAVALVALAACASSATPSDAGDAAIDRPTAPGDAATTPDAAPTASAITCPADAGVVFAPALATCDSETQCAAVVHGLDCCGSTEVVAIRRDQQAAYDAVETRCEARVAFNMCDCAARGPVAQDGRPIPPGASPVLACVGGVCLTRAP